MALAAGSVVLLTGGIAAMIRKAMRPVQAIMVVLTAIVVGAISLLATGFPRRSGVGDRRDHHHRRHRDRGRGNRDPTPADSDPTRSPRG